MIICENIKLAIAIKGEKIEFDPNLHIMNRDDKKKLKYQKFRSLKRNKQKK